MKHLFARPQGYLIVLLILGTAGAVAPRAWADAAYSTVILSDTPIGYWRLGESNTQPIAADSSPTGRNGVYSRGVTSGAPGAIADDPDTAAAFDGSAGYVDIPGGESNPYNLSNGFSLEAWVINNGPTESPVAGRIFSTRILPTSPTMGGYGFGVLTASGAMRFTTFGIQDYDSNVVVPVDGQYHYVAVTFDSNNTARFYLDGTLQQSVAGSSPAAPSPSDLNIGRNPVPNGGGFSEYWNGTIDEAAVYNYVLTDLQILAHFQSGL